VSAVGQGQAYGRRRAIVSGARRRSAVCAQRENPRLFQSEVGWALACPTLLRQMVHDSILGSKGSQEVLVRSSILLLAAALTAGAAHAQVAVGAITGTVRDSSGAVIPGAQV